jgi:CubicO group peptidase (beta-lactamase class C family)
MSIRKIFIWFLFVAIVALLPLVLMVRLRGQEQVSVPEYWPIEGWRSSLPEEQGFDSAELADGLQAIRQKEFNIHSLLIIRNGSVVVDAYFYPYDGQTVHDVASVTKSVMTTLIGIAADQGKLELDQPLVSFFPGRTIANRDASKEDITVRHLASMSAGLDCTADYDEATLREMQASPDWVQFTLDRPMIDEPGSRFVYCSPGMHLLSAILQQATGMTTLDFARQNLFEPLGIRDVVWSADPQGVTRGWGDLYMHPHDMAKLGYLWLNHGQWEGRQIVSRAWVEDSVKVQLKTGGDDDYGYGWWVTGEEGEYAAIGRGGQRIQVWPAWDLMLVMTGEGVDIDDIDPFLAPAFTGMAQPLRANHGGVAQLETALVAIAQPPAPEPVAPLPETAQAVSGQIFIFEPNPIEVEALGLEFDGSAEAMLHIRSIGGQMESWPVGLDGVYRMSMDDDGLPRGLRGGWADDQTFVLEYAGIAHNDHFTFRLHFEGDRALMEGQETAHDLGMRFEGRLEKP